VNTKPKRRRFHFSLRTLFAITTLIAIYLGWQASIVHERKALLAEGRERRLWIAAFDAPRWSVRTLMGDQSVKFISSEQLSQQDHFRLNDAFPEANGHIIVNEPENEYHSWAP
jgi:hypothetical protein